MILAKSTEKEFQKIPLPEAGTTQAVCCGVWDIGLQKTVYMGEEKIQHKIIVAWEIVEKINVPDSEYNGKPYMLNKKYTLSLGDKANLRKDLESWRGKPYTAEELKNGVDLEKLYGVNCYIGIKHEADKRDASKTYANISAILPLPKGVEKITPLRTRDEQPPKWVLEKIANAIPEPEPEPDDPFGPPSADGENFPY